MSGFEHYERELADLDREIFRYAALCAVNLENRHEIEACVRQHDDDWAADKARVSLKGLLILRIRLESEMLEQGLTPLSLVPPNVSES